MDLEALFVFHRIAWDVRYQLSWFPFVGDMAAKIPQVNYASMDYGCSWNFNFSFPNKYTSAVKKLK